MDPASAITFASECIGISAKVASIIKEIINAVKRLRGELLSIVYRVERTRRILTIIRSIAQRLQDTGHHDAEFLLDDEACATVMKKLLGLAGQIAEAHRRNRLLSGIEWWSKYKSVAEDLCASIQEQENELMNTIQLLHMGSTLDGLDVMRKIKTEVENQQHLPEAFDNETIRPQDVSQDTPKPTSYQVWLGSAMRKGLREDYVHDRDQLANAAYVGNWERVKQLISRGESKWKETWSNAFRLQTRDRLDRQSFWTPLHQAVYNNAPAEVICWLLDHGASRTLRTRTSDFAYRDMTSLELARYFGYSQMYDILSPIIRISIPYKSLELLQEQFHTLIREELSPQVVDDLHLRLPHLESLIELEAGMMRFPLREHKFGNAGFTFRLDGRDLLVLVENIKWPSDSRMFRVGQESYEQVEMALLVNVAE